MLKCAVIESVTVKFEIRPNIVTTHTTCTSVNLVIPIASY